MTDEEFSKKRAEIDAEHQKRIAVSAEQHDAERLALEQARRASLSSIEARDVVLQWLEDSPNHQQKAFRYDVEALIEAIKRDALNGKWAK